MALPSLLILMLLNLVSESVSDEMLLEDGYTVTTVLDGNKQKIHPFSVIFRPGTHDLIVLDSAGNVFYSVPFPTAQDSELNRFSGNGTEGYSDGDSSSAMFKKPRSFAVDLKGNVYVAHRDQKHPTIRKISKSGVTTIAGGYSHKAGNVDGPAQNASFSEDFELTFVPEICALLISDHGNNLVRQINLKPEDCGKGSGSVLGLTWVWWALGLVGLCVIIGLVIWFTARSSREVSGYHCFSEIGKHCQFILGRRVLIICSDIRSVIASSTAYILLVKLVGLVVSSLSLMFRIRRVENQKFKEPVSLLDLDCASNHETTESQIIADQLTGLTCSDGRQYASEGMEEDFKQNNEDHEGDGFLTDSRERVDDMIQANFKGFANQARQRSLVEGSSVLFKRR